MFMEWETVGLAVCGGGGRRLEASGDKIAAFVAVQTL